MSCGVGQNVEGYGLGCTLMRTGAVPVYMRVLRRYRDSTVSARKYC